MPAQLMPFALGIAIGIAVGFGIWKQPEQAQHEYARNEAIDPSALKNNEAKVEPQKSAPKAPTPEAPKPVVEKKAPVPKTPIAVKKKTAPGLTPDQLVAAHWAENIDAEWSETSIERLRRDFEKLETTHSFTVNSIDCRKTSCITVLEWGRQTEAEAAQPELLGAPYSLVCSKRLIFPPGRSKHGYQTTLVFFDCSSR